MKRGLWLACLVLLVTGCSGGGGDDNSGGLSQNACGVLGLKIINGGECSTGSSPVVSYEVSYDIGLTTSCTGTMITNIDILTAAHCFPGNLRGNISSVTAVVNGEAVPVVDATFHPGFEETPISVDPGIGLINDVAVLRLLAPVSVAPLPVLVSRSLAPNDIFAIFGYGQDESGNFGELKSGEMRTSDVTADVFTADFSGDGSNTCQGDSGGPAIVTLNGQPGVIGITSAGVAAAQCLEGDVSLFTNIGSASVQDFIFSQAPGVQTL